MPSQQTRPAIEYVVPLRWDTGARSTADPSAESRQLVEFTAYLLEMSRVADVTVVDGSDNVAFGLHARAWGPAVRHIRPEPWNGRNRKVAGVVTGVRLARHELVVIADDDIRYRPEQLRQVVAPILAGECDMVRPQNVFEPRPWHARWDTARSLLNRTFAADYPGTYALRRSLLLATGGYEGDVLFENLQMARTLRAAGGTERVLSDFYVKRRPPNVGTFLGQRVRQAYDDFAQPFRLLLESSLLPVLVVAAIKKPALLGVFAGVATVLAEAGRRRHGGARVYPRSSALWAPAWVLERAVCIWLAQLARWRGGVRYRGERLLHATLPIGSRPALLPHEHVPTNEHVLTK